MNAQPRHYSPLVIWIVRILNSRRIEKLVDRLLFWTLVGFLPAFLFWGYAHSEDYCFFDPWIDTMTSPTYSEAAFAKVQIGMSEQEVNALLGKPLSRQDGVPGTSDNWYTCDGKCKWGDFAWLGRRIWIQNGKVINKEARVYYD